MDKKILDSYVANGWLISQTHPTLPLTIYNYSRKTQYEKRWDEITLACRGLIVDSTTGKVIIKPFPKFFNYEEVRDEVPWKTSDYVYVQEKVDGSLGILFYYEGEWILSTRGSFTSDQAIKGLEILKAKYMLASFDPSFAYMCEIIYAKNRIVVDYKGKEKIVFLGVSLNRTYNWEASKDDVLHWTTALAVLKANGIKKSGIVKTTQVFDLGPELYSTLKDLNKVNEEGYVLHFFPSNLKVKIKFENYVELHRIVTQVSSYDIWENLRDHGNLPESFLNGVPDEFYSWVRKTESEILSSFRFLKSLHVAHVSSILRSGMDDRKLMAETFIGVKDPRINSSILFLIADGRNYDRKIWEMVKPEYSRPFSNFSEF